MSSLGKLTDRLLGVLGLDLDFTVDFRGQSLSPITEHLYVSGRPRPADIPLLKEAGITHVASCLEESERSPMAYLGNDFQSLFLPIRDRMDQDLAPSIQAFCDFASRARHADPAAKLLVHCEVGVSRSATLATALLMTSAPTTFYDAFLRVRAKRAAVLPNIGFASQLQRLEHALHPEARSSATASSLARYLREICNVPADLELLEQVLQQSDYDAPRALRTIFGDEIPRVVQGVRR